MDSRKHKHERNYKFYRREERRMKYIAIFDIPDDYVFGCACAKIAPKGKEVYTDFDFEYCYAEIEPLSEEKAEVFEKYNTTERLCRT